MQLSRDHITYYLRNTDSNRADKHQLTIYLNRTGIGLDAQNRCVVQWTFHIKKMRIIELPFPSALKTPFVPEEFEQSRHPNPFLVNPKLLKFSYDDNNRVVISRDLANYLNGQDPSFVIACADELKNIVRLKPTRILDELLDNHLTPKILDSDYDYIHAGVGFLQTEVDPPLEGQGFMRGCPVCSNSSNLKCKACMNISYCSREHQKQHWKSHRSECTMYDIYETGRVEGKTMIARRSIAAGELILKERPLITSPICGDSILAQLKFDTKEVISDKVKTGSMSVNALQAYFTQLYGPLCLGCSVQFENNRRNPFGHDALCKTCGWSLCNDCPMVDNHKMECQYFSQNGLKQEELQTKFVITARSIFVLRVLLLEKQKPELFAKLMQLENHLKERLESEKVHGVRLNDLYIAYVVKKAFLFHDITLQKVYTILGILDCNGFATSAIVHQDAYSQFDDDTNDPFGKKHISVYEIGSLINHSCHPNAVAISLDPPALEVVATRDIQKGEAIEINYINYPVQRGTVDRKAILNYIYFFDCVCCICRDSTENKCNNSAVVCTKCKISSKRDNLPIGYLLPVKPLDMNSKALWDCTSCWNEKPYFGIQKIVQDAYEISNKTGDWLESYTRIRSILHPNHYLILHIEQNHINCLIRQLTISPAYISTQEIENCVDLIEKRIDVISRLDSIWDRNIVSMRFRQCLLYEYLTKRSHPTEINHLVVKIKWIIDLTSKILNGHTKRNQLHAYLLNVTEMMKQILHRINRESRALISKQYEGMVKQCRQISI